MKSPAIKDPAAIAVEQPKNLPGWFSSFGAALLITVLAAAAYSNSFSGPWVLDDLPSIRDNPTIRHWGTAMMTPVASTSHGRPILNLSFALNYAMSGESVWSYHLVNLVIHVLAGLALFGVLRRTLLRFAGSASAALAFFCVLIWILHPLDTSAVTYVVQRAESLMGLFYLLTLYFFIRYARVGGGQMEEPHPRLFGGLCIGSCLLGMATKEVMVSAPVVVFLYDRTFVSGGFREAFKRHRTVLLGLAATWSVLICLVASTGGRGGTAGFGAGVSAWHYAFTQAHAIVLYLRLGIYPDPLIFYYGRVLISDPLKIVPQALLIAGLLGYAVWALKRAPTLGFLAASFFLILAASSSFVPVATETIAEHGMYLPLIPVVVLVVFGLYRWLGSTAFVICALIGAVLGAVTYSRNEVYRTALGLWLDTAANDPDNPWAHNNLGFEWDQMPGHSADAIAQFEQALRLKPDHAEAHYNLANDLRPLPGRMAEAADHYEQAIRSNPAYAQAHNNLGSLLIGIPGRFGDAVAQYQEALGLKADYAEAHYNLGNAWSVVPTRQNEAIREYQEAIRLKPDYSEAHNNLGKMFANQPDRVDEAVFQFQEAIRLNPGNAEAHYNLGSVLSGMPGRSEEAATQYLDALRLRPDYAEAHVNLGNLRAINGRLDDAIAQYREALRSQPSDPEGNFNLAVALLKTPGHEEEAKAHLKVFLKSSPGDERALQILGGIP